MIINHKKLNPTPIKIDEIVLHAMHCATGAQKWPKTAPKWTRMAQNHQNDPKWPN